MSYEIRQLNDRVNTLSKKVETLTDEESLIVRVRTGLTIPDTLSLIKHVEDFVLSKVPAAVHEAGQALWQRLEELVNSKLPSLPNLPLPNPVDESAIVSRVLAQLPAPVDESAIVSRVLAQLPAPVASVAPASPAAQTVQPTQQAQPAVDEAELIRKLEAELIRKLEAALIRKLEDFILARIPDERSLTALVDSRIALLRPISVVAPVQSLLR